MPLEQFESLSLYFGVGGLILYMFFIMYKLAQESKAGKFGSFVIFFSLGLGILAFIIKELITFCME